VHHVLPIFIAYNFFPEISREAITSLDNAIALCHDCHRLIHDGIDELIEEDVQMFIEIFSPVAHALLQKCAVSSLSDHG